MSRQILCLLHDFMMILLFFTTQIYSNSHVHFIFLLYLYVLDAWLKILEPVESQRKDTNRVNLFPGYITGEVRIYSHLFC